MAGIFISYRRDDAQGEALHLSEGLKEKFGAGSVFMDVTGIDPGRDFRKVIESAVGTCDVLLVVIGRNWVSVANAAGQQRLEDPKDFVRLEVATALRRDIPVVPVLVHGASLPTQEQLPDELDALVWRNAFELRHNRWARDVEELVEALRRITAPAETSAQALMPQEPAPAPQRRNRMSVVTGGGVVVLAALAAVVALRSFTSDEKQALRAATPASQAATPPMRAAAPAPSNGKVFAQGWTRTVASGISDAAATLGGRVWLVGKNGSVSYTDDGTVFSQVPAEGFARIAAGSDGRVWAVGANHALWRYADGVWQQTPAREMVDVAVGRQGRVWLVRRDGTVWFTEDGQKFNRVPGEGFARIDVGPDTTVWAVGSNGTVWAYRKGQWVQTDASEMADVGVSSDGRVWLAGKNGTVWFTRDGSKFTRVEADGMAGIAGGRSEAWAVGQDGSLWKSP